LFNKFFKKKFNTIARKKKQYFLLRNKNKFVSLQCQKERSITNKILKK
jgi:hypothetical protein